MQCRVSVWMQRLNSNLAGDNFAHEKKRKKTQTLIGANAVNSFIMRPTISWNMVVPKNNTTWRINSCGDQRRTS